MTEPLNFSPNAPPLGNPVPAALKEQCFFPVVWREEPGGTAQFKQGESHATMNLSASWSQIQSIAPVSLGYPVYLGGGSRKINRAIPQFHPCWPWLYAVAITNFRGQKQTGWEVNAGPYMSHSRVQWTCVFQSLNYIVKKDSDVSSEVERFVTFDFMPGVELLTRRAGNFLFQEGPVGIINTSYPQAVFVRSPKSTLKITWFQVPHMAVFGRNSGLLGKFNPNWLRCLSRVNDAYWPNPQTPCFKPSEMLLVGISATPHEAAVSPGVLGLGYLGVSRTWDIVYTFSILTPPRDPAFPVDPLVFPTRWGHNLLPAPNSPGGFYYYALGNQAGTNTHTVPVYQSASYADLFLGYD